MNYEKWDEILAPYQHAVEELKVKFKNIRKEFLTKEDVKTRAKKAIINIRADIRPLYAQLPLVYRTAVMTILVYIISVIFMYHSPSSASANGRHFHSK